MMKGNNGPRARATPRAVLAYLAALAFGLPVAACTAPEEASPAGPAALLDGSWIDRVVDEPQTFVALTDGPAREGWIALHASDLDGAARAFDIQDPAGGPGASATAPSLAVGRARALLELSLLYGDLARSGDQAWLSTFATWSEKSTLPPGSALTYVAGLAAREQGDAEVAAAWFKLSATAKDPEVARAAALLVDLPPGAPAVGDDLPRLLVRYNQHLAARASGDCADLLAHAAEPLVQEQEVRPDGTTLQRSFYDPQILRTLAVAARVQAAEALGAADAWQGLAQPPGGTDPLALLIFGPVPHAEDLAGEISRAAGAPGTLGASNVALGALGLDPDLPASDEADWAREQVRRLDAAFDAWGATAHAAATPDGQALLDDLRLVSVLRSRLLLALARKATLAGHPWQAKAFAQLAIDAESAREITAVNHPALQAVLIETQLQTGHTREALDSIQPLVGTYPALTGLDEVLGDLAILQGLDRYGDSKEN